MIILKKICFFSFRNKVEVQQIYGTCPAWRSRTWTTCPSPTRPRPPPGSPWCRPRGTSRGVGVPAHPRVQKTIRKFVSPMQRGTKSNLFLEVQRLRRPPPWPEVVKFFNRKWPNPWTILSLVPPGGKFWN
jgi:hypothetical protein